MSNTKNKWSDAENSQLKALWGSISSRKISEQAISRSPCAIRARAKRMRLPLELPKRFWTTSEVKQLKISYPIVGTKCAKSLGRSTHSVKRMAKINRIRLKIRRVDYFDILGKTLPSGLQVIELLECRKKNGRVWLFKCHCGNMGAATSSNLRFGKTKSCGCLRGKHA